MNKIILGIIILITLSTVFVLGLNLKKTDTVDNTIVENKEEAGVEADDKYQNSIYPGQIKKINIDKDGKVSLDIDILPLVFSKETYLASNKNFQNGLPYGLIHGTGWTSLDSRFESVVEAEKAINNMTDIEFSNTLNTLRDKLIRDKLNSKLSDFELLNNYHILNTGFPGRNESNKIRRYVLSDKNISIIPRDSYEAKEDCENNPDSNCFTVNKLIENPFIIEDYTFYFTIKNGLIEDIEYIWRS